MRTRMSLTKRRSADLAAGKALSADRSLRRSMSESSLGKRRASSAEVGDASAPTPAPKYKQDSEAYKRRESPLAAVMALLKSGNSVNGVKVK